MTRYTILERYYGDLCCSAAREFYRIVEEVDASS
jgi:hypothetical protein